MDYVIKQQSDDVIKSIFINRGINYSIIDNWLYADESSWEDP